MWLSTVNKIYVWIKNERVNYVNIISFLVLNYIFYSCRVDRVDILFLLPLSKEKKIFVEKLCVYSFIVNIIKRIVFRNPWAHNPTSLNRRGFDGNIWVLRICAAFLSAVCMESVCVYLCSLKCANQNDITRKKMGFAQTNIFLKTHIYLDLSQ